MKRASTPPPIRPGQAGGRQTARTAGSGGLNPRPEGRRRILWAIPALLIGLILLLLLLLLKVSQADRGGSAGVEPGEATLQTGTGEEDQPADNPAEQETPRESPTPETGSGAARAAEGAEDSSPSPPPLSEEEEKKFLANQSGAAARNSLRPPHTGVSFYGIEGVGGHIGFVVDNSGSMSGLRIERAKQELIKSLDEITADQTFSIYFFNSVVVTDPRFQQQPMDDQIRAAAKSWIQNIYAMGGTEPVPALAMAFDHECDVIFFLTDGEFAATAAEITRLNRYQATIHTIAIGGHRDQMQEIARQNSGVYSSR
jgi:hypothetical protein